MLTRRWPGFREAWPCGVMICLLLVMRKSGLAIVPAFATLAEALSAFLFVLALRNSLLPAAALYCVLVHGFAWLIALMDGYTAFIYGLSMFVSAFVLCAARPRCAIVRAALGALAAGGVSVACVWLLLLRGMTPGAALNYAFRQQLWPFVACLAGYAALPLIRRLSKKT